MQKYTKKDVFTQRILAILMFLLLFSCTHKTELKHEQGVVIDKVYSPKFDGTGTGLGVSSSGSIVVSGQHIVKDEQFSTVFKCEHGTVFAVDNKDVYYKLEKGDTVIIDYCDLIGMNGSVKDYEFFDANKK